MKKIILALFAGVLSVSVMAGQVYDRTEVTLDTTTGTVDWENTYDYSAVKLARVWALSSLSSAGATVSVVRVSADGLYTQAVASITGTLPSSSATFTAAYLKPGDILRLTSTPTTGAVAQIEFEVQQH
jgi:hypothetical protein